MSNSPLASLTLLSPNRTSPRNHAVDRISVHCYVGQVTVQRALTGFSKPEKQASCNYAVGKDGQIGLCVEESDRSWCSSSRENDHRAVTIEVASDTKAPYAVTDAAFAALLDLCEDICRRNGKTRLLWLEDREKTLAYEPAPEEMVMTVHRWFANKACPGQYLLDRHGQIAAEVTRRLSEPETGDPASEWARPSTEKAKRAGVFRGDESRDFHWHEPVTREELAVALDRLGVLGA